ncbi:Uncharacterised protein [Moraxella caprae]|uniref:Uncharacterized protein n=1 Tax=Moraxella caprae TaxID=90240 RepID=A0A378R1W8_9GAMM|nr:hypothetical protein [Moraxella caprae]STZ09215.1 Uncharacterised protein [Moraxella caprae]
MSIRYDYKHEVPPQKIDLPCDKNAGHGDHWAILTNNIADDVPDWLQAMLETATLPAGLTVGRTDHKTLLLGQDTPCHIKQILTMDNGKPTAFINAYPSVHSPYGVNCQIERVIRCERTADAILRLRTTDGTTIYAFDQLYAINRHEYKTPKNYFANFSAWAYNIEPSNKDETLLVKNPKAIRYHRAFNDIVADNGGIVPDDIDEQIKTWTPKDGNENMPLAPVEINFGESCIYLFGDTFGQEDEAWCQGQVLGISRTEFFGIPITLFDVAILREPNAEAFVVRIAAVSNEQNRQIQVQDYIQANVWLQVAIYAENQQRQSHI